LKETVDKSVIIADQKAELERLLALVKEPTATNVAPQAVVTIAEAENTEMEVHVVALDHIVENVTYGLVETETMPLGRRRASLIPPPNLTQQPPETQWTQDSLSFPPIDELGELRAFNLDLKSRLSSVVEQYYQWKLACILSVDKNRQMALEFKKIDNEYLENNAKREFGLTSWAHTDELFPWSNIPMKKVNNALSIIVWKNCGWDYKNSMSCHNLKGDPDVQSTKLWPNPSIFVLDGTVCAVCMYAFGKEGGFHLGSCDHIYHPMCLISFMVTRRRCRVCKAPFYERLYDLFGLHPYMPISWELNQDNAPALRHLWGDDLVWSWQIYDHSHNKSNLSSQFLWEDDHEEIVRVCQKLIGFGTHNEGQRNFFYQCFNGHWDERNGRFQFGPHLDRWM
jgi:hypothetical protein